MAHFRREARQLIVADVQVIERREMPHLGREVLQHVAVEI
jgi:hypothetical protein